MDPQTWFLDLPLTTEDPFTLPASIPSSTHAFWPAASLSDFPLVDIPSAVPLPNLAFQNPCQKTEDTVSDVTDIQLLTSSPSTHPIDRPARPQPLLKPRPTLAKPGPARPARHIPVPERNCEHSESSQKARDEGTSLKRPSDEMTRQRHNQMMRENRGRFNAKFRQLTALLESLKTPKGQKGPMKNKIQILERAMFQYAHMESLRASYKHQLLFPERNEVQKGFSFEGTGVTEACQLVVRNLCAGHGWKYGEVWGREQTGFELEGAFISPNNMPATRVKLQRFARTGAADGVDPFLLKLSLFKHAIWISDLGKKGAVSRRARHAVEAGVTTMLAIPVCVHSSKQAEVIVIVMHADDELLPSPGRVRSFDVESVCRLTEWRAAVVESGQV